MSFNSNPGSRSSGIHKPKLAKVRKQVNPRNFKCKGQEDATAGPSFKPFPPPVDSSEAFPSISGSGGSASMHSEFRFVGNGGNVFVFGADNSYFGGKPTSGDHINDGVVGKMRNLKLDSQIKDRRCSDMRYSFREQAFSELPDRMENLHINHFQDLTGSERGKGLGFRSKARKGKKFVFSAEYVDSFEGGVMEDELHNKLKDNLNLGSIGNACDNGDTKHSYDKEESVCDGSERRSDRFAGTSTQFVNDKLKNLDIKSGSTLFNDNCRPSTRQFDAEGPVNCREAVGNQIGEHDTNYSAEKDQNAASKHIYSNNNTYIQAERKPPVYKKPGETVEIRFSSEQKESRKPFMEFDAHNSKGFLFSCSNHPLKFSAKREAFQGSKVKRRGKSKQSRQTQLNLGQDLAKENVSCHQTEESEPYSPMDISPYNETVVDTAPQDSGESSMQSDKTLDVDIDNESTSSPCTVSNNIFYEELAGATQCLNINEIGLGSGTEKMKSSESHTGNDAEPEDKQENSLSGAETESFKSAAEEMEGTSESFTTAADTEGTSSLKSDGQDGDYMRPEATSSNFIFSAASAIPRQMSALKRRHKKKTHAKWGQDTCNSKHNVVLPCVSPSLQFNPVGQFQPPSSSGKDSISDSFTFPCMLGHKSEAVKVQEGKNELNTAQKACEQLRLRGNNAYTKGDLSKAEECYTKGINSVPPGETSRSCHRALMLCYSNRAATRMSDGRIREALLDCMAAALIDPTFLRVQVRAGNCCLALGEVEHALQYFKKCLHSRGDPGVDRKIHIDASTGLQKAQKVSDCMHQSAELLNLKASSEAEKALEILSEALSISMYSEKLLEMKAAALFMLHKYVDAIKLCEMTFDAAEKNSPPLEPESHRLNPDGTEMKETNFRIWRCCVIFKCYFHLGKLEEAIAFLEKQAELPTDINRNGSENLETFISLGACARELLRLKAAGNEAFKAGKHAKAVELYTSALSCNVESRPFTAICVCNRAAAFKALKQITDAIADCSLAIALDGNYLKAISRRAALFEMIRDYGQAATDIERLIVLLTKQVEEKNRHGACDISIAVGKDLRHAHLRVSELKQNARKGFPLDMYLILGVEPTCSASDIRKAYRKAALRHHPDKAGQFLSKNENGDDRLWKEIGEEVHGDAERLFKLIGEAYGILSDPEKRSQYDAEEEMRNAQRRSSIYKTYSDAQSYKFERSNMRNRWGEAWKSYGNTGSKWRESNGRQKRYPH